MTGRHAKGPASAGAEGEARGFNTGTEALSAENSTDQDYAVSVVPFPRRGPFAVHVVNGRDGWLVVCRDHGWLHGDRREAITDARIIAAGFGVAVEVTP